MNYLGNSSNSYIIGNFEITEDLTVGGNLELNGSIDIVGDIVIDPSNCLLTDCIKPSTASGNIDLKNSTGNSIIQLYDDQTMGAFSIFGFSGLTLSSDSAGETVMQLDQGLGVPTAGVRILNSKLNVDQIQSQSHEVSGNNPKILFTAAKVEITGDTPIEFETKTILTTEIKKDDTGGNMIIKSADGTQIIRTDDALTEIYMGEDADGYRMPKLRGTIGHILTMSNTGLATFEEPQQTGSSCVIGAILTPRTTFNPGVYQNVANFYTGTTAIVPGTWSMGDIFTIKIEGYFTSTVRTTTASYFRFDIGQSLLSQVSQDVSPDTLSILTSNPFQITIALTLISSTQINWIGNGLFKDNNGSVELTKQFTFGKGTLAGYDDTQTLTLDLFYKDDSTGGTNTFVSQSGIWCRATPMSVDTVVSSNDHTALSNLTLSDAGHSQFALLNGRTSDQTLHGSDQANGNLYLGSTSNATKGQVIIIDQVVMNDRDIVSCRGVESNSDLILRTTGATSSVELSTTGNILQLDNSSGNLNYLTSGYVNINSSSTNKLDFSGTAMNIIDTNTYFLSLPATTGQVSLRQFSSLPFLPLTGGTVTGDLKVNGVIDSADAGTLAIAPADATKLELGASDITTEVKGDLFLSGGNIVSTSDNVSIGYVEPLRTLFAVASSITVSDRSFIKASNGSYANAIGSIVINCGSTTQNYRLVTRVNSSGSIWRLGLGNNTNPNSSFGVGNFVVFGSSGGGSNGGGIASGSGGTEEVDITTQAIADGDYIEYILNRTCQDFYVYYHGATLTDTPTLLYKIAGMTMASARWFIGDASLIVSAFDIDTIESTGLVVADDVKIGGTLTVDGSLISPPSSISTTTAWEIGGIPIVAPPADTVLKIAKSGNVVNIGFGDFEGKTPAAGQFESVYVLPVGYRPSTAVKCAVLHINASVPNIGTVEILPTGVLKLGSQAASSGWAINIDIKFLSPSITYNVV
jgi:hypothetical protein